jgi:hypothetical protein
MPRWLSAGALLALALLFLPATGHARTLDVGFGAGFVGFKHDHDDVRVGTSDCEKGNTPTGTRKSDFERMLDLFSCLRICSLFLDVFVTDHVGVGAQYLTVRETYHYDDPAMTFDVASTAHVQARVATLDLITPVGSSEHFWVGL